MKKLLAILFFTLSSLFLLQVNAYPIRQQTAATAAGNFYNQIFSIPASTLTVAYTEYDDSEQPVYYVFNVNIPQPHAWGEGDGFVIVSAESAAHPILGYSNKGQFVIPGNDNNVAWWLNCRKEEIITARIKNIAATSDINDEWTNYNNNTKTRKIFSVMSSVGPLVQSMWDQPGPYNDMCPGGSVTGCVATAMAQILRYWSYPSHGHGYSAYWEKQSDGFAETYGYLQANYDTSNYVWSAMPYSISSNNNEIAKVMYDCGVSVDMNYSPGESGAWVINGDYPVSSQNSYVKYFGYDRHTVQGVYKSNYSYANWKALIMNELKNHRPVQYVGNDSVNNAGHTWVCDGDSVASDTLFHMNWGWGGSDNGYFALNALYVGYNFDWWDEAVIGIEPPAVSAYFAASTTFGCPNVSINFYDSSISTSAITLYKWTFPGGTPATSTSASPAIVYKNPGTYDVTEIVTDGTGSDTMVRKAYISIAPSDTIPVLQNFQSSVFPPAGWSLNNPHSNSYTWQLNTTVGGYGASTQCMEFNNTQVVADYYTIYTGLWVTPPGKPAVDIIGQRQQLYSPEYNFTYVLNPEIYFDVAYAPYNIPFSDTLNIYYSTDCGATFHSVYSKGGTTLGTTGNMVSTGADTNSKGIFTPSASNWRTDTIHLAAVAGMPSVMFSFENVSGNGAAMYIDNIHITGKLTSAVPTITNKPVVSVYPNPSNGQFTFQSSAVGEQLSVEIYNVLGEKIYSQHNISNQTFNINLNSQPKGIYIYRIFSETGASVSTGRLVVE